MRDGHVLRRPWPILIALVLGQAVLLQRIGNGLSQYGDPPSEADAIRSAQFYVEHGLFRNAGLPVITYGERFAYRGWLAEERLPADQRYDVLVPLVNGVYTRYPPLPNWLCAVYEWLFGDREFGRWRLIPVALGLLALLSFYKNVSAALGASRASIVLLSVGVLPMLNAHLSGLHFSGYALSALLVEVGVLLRACQSERFRGHSIACLLALGFVQGYLGFDHAFVVTFAPVSVWLLSQALWPARTAPLSHMVLSVLAAGGAFTVAHALHFWQVASFYSSARRAWNDLAERAAFRALGNESSPYVSQLGDALVRVAGEVFSPLSQHMSVWFLIACLLWSTAAVMGQLRSRWLDLDFRAASGAIAGAAVIAVLWICVMPAMTVKHLHLVPRHMVLPYLIIVIALVGGWRARLTDPVTVAV